MIEFAYKARDCAGVSKRGTIQAVSRSSAASQLRNQGLIVLGVAAVKNATNEVRSFQWDLGRWLKPRAIDVEMSLQQLTMMLRGGINLLTALNMLVEQAPRRSLGLIWEQIARDVQTGESFSKAMAQHSCFPDFTIQLVRVGERTGELVPVVERAVRTMRGRRMGVREMTSALIYPMLVVLIAIGVTIYMVVYLIPRLEIYLQSLGKEVPAMTQNLVNTSIWLRQSYPALAIVGCAIAVMLTLVYRSREGRMAIDRFAIQIPIIGRLFCLCETTTFSRSLSIMLGSGITLIDALGTVEKLIYNRFTAQTVTAARERIIQGGNFSDAIESNGAFSPMLKKMVSVGEQSGDLKGVLQEVADFHEDLFRSSIKRLNAILTPLLTVMVGGVVGYVYIAFFVALMAAGG